MKTSTFILTASLLLNATLLGILVMGSMDGDRSAKRPAAAELPVAVKQAPTPASPVDAWSELRSADLAQQRDRLRAEGFPPSVVRAIVGAQVRESFAARRKAVEPAGDVPFWKRLTFDPQSQAALRALAKEEQKIMRDLLGPDFENGLAARLRQQFPGVAPEKVDQLTAIRERYDEQRQEIYGFGGGQLTPGEREKLAAVEKAMHTEFAAVLTPEELEQYDLRTSNTANSLRQRLRSFDATEAEFRTLYRLQRAFDEQHAFTGAPSTPEQSRLRSEAQQGLQKQIEAELGAARFADYQRSSDYQFQQASLLVARLGLPAATATSLYDVQKEFEKRRNDAYRSSTPATRQDLPQHMTALQEEATARITAILGGNRTVIDAYKQYGGSWLVNFAPRPPPAPTK